MGILADIWFYIHGLLRGLWIDEKDRGVVFVRYGSDYRLALAKRKGQIEFGELYQFNKRVVIAPPGYPWVRFLGDRTIFVDNDSVIGVFPGSEDSHDVSFISDFMLGNEVRKLADSYEFSVVSWKMFAILGVIGVIGYLIYSKFFAGGDVEVPADPNLTIDYMRYWICQV